MYRKMIASMVALSMLLPNTAYLYAKENGEDPKQEETKKSVSIEQIAQDMQDKTFKLDEKSLLKIGSEKDPITIKNCTFELSGKTNTEADPNSREMKTYSKVLVNGNVTFENCTFKIQGEQRENSPMDCELYLEDGMIEFDGCDFEIDGYQGRAIGAYQGDVTFLKSTIQAVKTKKAPVLSVYEAKVVMDETKIDIQEGQSEEGMLFANGQSTGSIYFENSSDIVIENNAGTAMVLNATPIALKDSKLEVKGNQAGIEGGNWQITNEGSATLNDNQGLGLSLKNNTMKIDSSTLEVNGNQGAYQNLTDVNTVLDTSNITVRNTENVVLGSYVDLDSKIDLEKNGFEIGTKLDVAQKEETPENSNEGESSQEEAKTKQYTISIRMIDAENNEDLVQKSVGPLDEKAEYDIEPEIEAMLPKGYEIQEITETNKQGTSGTIQQDLEFVIQVMKQQEQKKEPEVNLYTLSLRYINAVNEEDIATVPLKDQKENEEVDLKTIALAHLPEGYKIVELPKEESLVMKQDESVDIYIQPINEYYVRVNYLDEETNKSIHYANKIAGLVQGSDWDASRFDQIKINGYTHVKTEGQVKGDAIAQDVTINVYYKKDSKGSADTNKDDSKKDPTKVDAANTATKTNEGLYITIGFVALAAILLFAFKLKRSHKKD